MECNTIARVLVTEYGSQYHLELRETLDYKGRTIYRLYNVYDLDYPKCEDVRGFVSYSDIDEALMVFQEVCGCKLSDEYVECIKRRIANEYKMD